MAAETPDLDTIFSAAVEIASAEERAAYLDRVCGGDVGLRERVGRLVDAHFQAGAFLERPALGPGATGDFTPAPAAAPPEGPGTLVGPYKLLQQIGEGGMGAVFMAEQTHPVQRKVALKVIKAGMDSRQVIARFEAERQALALMDHPNIAKVLDGGTTDGGRPFIVMELVKGVPLSKYCDERKLTPRERLELMVPVCQAVQHAHQKGVIHRDLKPSNVMVCLYDGKPVPKVIDFGVAKAAGPKLTERTLFTEFGAVIGTLEYMSPEQAELNQLDIDTRSDIFSLGVILYELLTGTTPLEHKRLKAGGLLEALRLIREEEPPRPSTRLSTTEELPAIAASRGVEPRKLSGLVRGELDWIVMKCLEKDRGRRYETANGLARDLQRYLADEPVQACPPSVAYRFRKFARRNRAALATAVALLVGLLTAGVALAVSDYRVREEQQAKVEALQGKVTAEEQRAEALNGKVQAERQRADKEADRAQARESEAKTLGRWRQTAYYREVELALREYRDGNVAQADERLERCQQDLRRWEWDYLKQLCHSEKSIFQAGGPKGPRNPIAALSPDGRLVAVLDARNVLHIYDTTTGKQERTLQVPIRVNEVAFSAEGKSLAVSGDVKWRNQIGTWRAPNGLALAIHPQQDYVTILDTFERTNWFVLPGRRARVTMSNPFGFCGAAFGPGGRLLAATDRKGNLFLWDVEAGVARHYTDVTAYIVLRMRTAAAAPAAPLGALSLLMSETISPRPQPFIPRFEAEIHSMAGISPDALGSSQAVQTKPAFSPDGRLVATACDDEETIKL